MTSHKKTSRLKTLLTKAPLSKRQVFTAVLAAGMVAGLGYSGTATAKDYVTSSDILNQTIRSWDIAPEGVGSSEVRNQSLRSVDIARGGVGTSEVRNQSLKSGDIAPNGVGRSEIREGSVDEPQLSDEVRAKLEQAGQPGPKGEKGDPGEDGQDGKDGVSGYEVIGRGTDAKTVAPEDGVVEIVTKCASEDSSAEQQAEVALGGGATGGGNVTLHASHPSGIEQVSESDSDDPAGRWKATSWTVKVSTDAPVKVQPFVLCANMA